MAANSDFFMPIPLFTLPLGSRCSGL